MDYEAIKRLGLEHYNINVESSDELYDHTTNNHIILLKLKKEAILVYHHCELVNCVRLRSSVKQSIKHSSSLENNIIIKFYRRIFKCECGKTFSEPNSFTESKRKNTGKSFVKTGDKK